MAFELEEEWAPVDGFPNYIVSTFGQILNVKFGRYLEGRTSVYGFVKVALYENGKSQEFYKHHLVAQTFLTGYSEGVHVRFKDGDKTNCRLDNLRFGNGRGLGVMKSKDQWGRHVPPNGRFILLANGEPVDSFWNVRTLAEFIGADVSTVYKHLRGERKSVRGYSVETVED